MKENRTLNPLKRLNDIINDHGDWDDPGDAVGWSAAFTLIIVYILLVVGGIVGVIYLTIWWSWSILCILPVIFLIVYNIIIFYDKKSKKETPQ